MAEQQLSTCVLKLYTFLSRPMQNNNVKSPQISSSASQNRDGKLFLISIWNSMLLLYEICNLRNGKSEVCEMQTCNLNTSSAKNLWPPAGRMNRSAHYRRGLHT